MTTYFAVRRAPGAGWLGGIPLRSRPLWPEHVVFMDALAAERFVVLGGTLEQMDAGARERVRAANLSYMRSSGIRSVEANVVYAIATKI